MKNTINSAEQESWISAWRFAAEIHKNQQFPGTELPYLVHLGMVSMEILVAHAAESIDQISLAMHCSIWHDSMEDQAVPYEALLTHYGAAVAEGVAALSKNPAIPKQERLADSIRRIRMQPHAVWCVKLADRISNLQPPPSHWPAEKIAAYRVEAQIILDELGCAHAHLAHRLREKIAHYPGIQAKNTLL